MKMRFVAKTIEAIAGSMLGAAYLGSIMLAWNVQVMAKIEKPQAVQDLEEIVELCDAIMVARCVIFARVLSSPFPPLYTSALSGHVLR